MSLKIQAEMAPNHVHVLHLVGKMISGEGMTAFRNTMQSIRSTTPEASVILDMAGVEYIDSTGMGELVSSFMQAQKGSQRLVLVRLTNSIKSLLQTTKLLTIFEVYDDLETAQRALAKS